MANGQLALVLHAHLPYVRSSEPGSLEEDWYFQALQECYLPLLDTLETAAADPEQHPRLTLGLSPTLLSLLADPGLNARFLPWLDTRLELLAFAPPGFEAAATDLRQQLEQVRQQWQACDGQLVPRFRRLQQGGVLDLITCGATHGYLPLLRQVPEAVRAQLLNAVREHRRLLGEPPLGIWLPECAYYEGLDQQLVAAGLRYSVLDGHGLLHGQPRPRYGVFAPICSPAGVAFFGRDGNATLPVWSAREGYPGDGAYREFHRDLGWDLPEEQLREAGIRDRRPLGLKLHRVSGRGCPLDRKQPYDPALAQQRIDDHATDYLDGRRLELSGLAGSMAQAPLLVAPFDAELFGHWWFEGPRFLAALFRRAAAAGVELVTLREVLARDQALQLCHPSPSSWGQGGYHDYWLNDSNAWVVAEWQRASRAMVRRVNRGVGSAEQQQMLTQAGRELLLAQSSDWSFILRAGTTTELARERIERHLERFWRLLDAIETGAELPPGWLRAVQREDALLPELNAADWVTPLS
ncbi:glycoside hydrolase, family 57 [Cyanobium sp. PCC 7001]|uniref:glycoside hydrolase family 57 protein n=1 Tax=Cyanobium sp. PCC 7001 TaxID=180281 RepID=UPI0001805428|nr:1,4-alpha-glucan branching protein domain-containing protein [Cyanobium sp. PCC 7001]EDY37242.1 glycoside hydrolase, family 57 [Cyanobium sp. PCC 7001]